MLHSIPLAVALALTPAFAATAPDPQEVGLEYRLIGPNVGGRVARVSGVVGDPTTWYFGAAQGGIWKSVDRPRHSCGHRTCGAERHHVSSGSDPPAH